jgi:hypothetical protein
VVVRTRGLEKLNLNRYIGQRSPLEIGDLVFDQSSSHKWQSQIGWGKDCEDADAVSRRHDEGWLTEDNAKTKKVLEAARQAGYELVTKGKISKDLLSVISQPSLQSRSGGANRRICMFSFLSIRCSDGF